MPTFFVPFANETEQAERVWQDTKRFMEEQGHQVLDRRIYQLTYSHDGTRYHDAIGEVNRAIGERVLVILDAGNLFLVCTPNRGVIRGGPILVGKHWDTHET